MDRKTIPADHVGELFWEPGINAEDYARAQARQYLLFPSVPLHGKAPEKATLIAVIDSGVSSSHPQLAGYLHDSSDFSGEGLEDTIGHGTAVALVALYGNGLTKPPLAILSAKVTDRKGKIQEEAVVKAIDWVAERGAKVVNLSLGFRGSRDEYKALCAAIARHPHIQFFAAAGNYGPDVQVFPAACGHGNVLSVGANDKIGKHAAYSGPGAVYAPGSVTLQKEWAYYYESAQAFAQSGRLLEARLEYERAVATEPNAESEFQLGLIDLVEKNQMSAVNRFRQAIKLNPGLAEAHEMLGASMFLLGDYQSAEKALRKSIDLYPEDVTTVANRGRARFNLGQTLLNLGRFEEARIELEEVKKLVPDYPRVNDVLRSIIRK